MQFRFVVCAFVIGIGLRSVFEFSPVVILWLMMLSFGLAVLWRRKSQALSAPALLLTSLCLLAFSLGITRTEIASWQFGVSELATELGGEIELTGIVSTEPDYREHSVHLYIETEEDKVLVTTDRQNQVHYGDKVTVVGKLEKPESFPTDLGRIFDYPKYLQAKGVEYLISFAAVEVVETGLGNPIIALLLWAKEIFIESVERIIPPPASGLSSGLLLGVKSSLGDDIENDFRKTGIIHIVVLSGYNVMLVVSFFMLCFSFFLPIRLRVIVGIISIVCFALVVGLSATVVRASIMAVLVLVAQAFGRQYNVMRGLFMAGVVMLLINPHLLIYDIGFQLSFMATLGLLLIVPQFEKYGTEGTSWFGVKEFFLATCATQIAVLPLLLYHIGEVSLIAVVVNVVVLPIVPVAMFFTFATGIIGLFSLSTASVVGYITKLSLDYILWVAHFFASLPFASVTVPEFSAIGVFILYAMMIILYLYISRKNNDANIIKDWTVVEEKEKVGSQSEPTQFEELPVFFR
ncbi:ComEC/Rec2 family competence protein [Candidatus Nomurabacteria bacterium]|nr:ComEC/Rec2 family competence protein [Candidatus Nomurabacteria bacterium]